MFRDREEAGRRLAEALESYRCADALVLAIPRGAVVLAAEVAEALGLGLDIVVVRKIGAPGNPEFAAGAVDEDGVVIANPDAGAPRDYLEAEGERERLEIVRRLEAYRGGRSALDVHDRTVILVDDGVATGFTALKAVDFLKRRGAGCIVLAVPVISCEAERLLRDEVNEIVALEVPRVFFAVGGFYDRFPQVSDDEVRRILSERPNTSD